MSQRAIPVDELIRRLAQRARDRVSEETSPTAPARKPFPAVIPAYGTILVGLFKEEGAGSPPHRMGQWSHFVKVQTLDGMKTAWGSDLKRAVVESQTKLKVDSLIGIQRIGYQILKLPDGRKLQRGHWQVERIEYLAERLLESRRAREAQFRGRNTAPPPSLPPAFVEALKEAEGYANDHMRNPVDRERFLESVKSRLLLSFYLPTDSRLPVKDRDAPSR